MRLIDHVRQATGLQLCEPSFVEVEGTSYGLGLRGPEKFLVMVGEGEVRGERFADWEGKPVVVGPADHEHAELIRRLLPWTAPRPVGLARSFGFGDRLGMATPGHIRAVRGSGLRAVLAQQSIRELERTRRTPRQVIDCATWGVLQEGYREGFGADADHLQEPEDIGLTAAAGFTMFTIDPRAHVENVADNLDLGALAERFEALDFGALETSAEDLRCAYLGKSFALEGGGKVSFGEEAFLRAALKYVRAIAHTAMMFRHLKEVAQGEFELEVSVDETESPTSPAQHYFFAAELKRLGVEWVSLAPRFVGRFEKGVDYIGDLGAFRRSFAEHVAVMRTLGPYKISIHSGSDKFSIYPIVAELTGGMVHVKTAGTSYLEALRVLAGIEPALLREILDFARGRYETDRATYHVSADVAKVPAAASVRDDDLAGLLEDFDARQVLHVTFGSVMTADDGERFGRRIDAALRENEEAYCAAVARHLARHVGLLR